MALGKVSVLEARTALWSRGTSGGNKRKKHFQTLPFWATENEFMAQGNGYFFTHPGPSAFPFLLHQETSPNRFQLRWFKLGLRSVTNRGWNA